MVAVRLIKMGKKISYRPHHAENPAYIDFVIKEAGLAGQVLIDTTPEFQDSLVKHAMFLSQTQPPVFTKLFYAGWPTIFYEPMMDHDYFVGLPIAQNIYRPIANNPEVLLDLIVDAFDESSEIARFPEKFTTELAPRFIGVEPAHSATLISEFIAGESFKCRAVDVRPGRAE